MCNTNLQVNFLLSIGGATEAKMVTNMAQKIYSIDLQSKTTWFGVRDKSSGDKGFIKLPMVSTKIPHIIAGNIFKVLSWI